MMRKIAIWTAALAVAAGTALGTAGISSADVEARGIGAQRCFLGGGVPDYGEGVCDGGQYDGQPL